MKQNHKCLFLSNVLAFFLLARIRLMTVGTLIAVLVIGVMAPVPARAVAGLPDLFSAITNVVSTINNVIGPLLNTALGILGNVSSVLNTFRSLWDEIVYPLELIERARAVVANMILQYRAILADLLRLKVLSAQLPNPAALESVIRNRGTSDFARLAAVFRQTYRDLPLLSDAHPIDRDLVDIDDAMAMGNLKTLKASDQAVDQMMAAANVIEDEGQRMAPGSAPFLAGAGFAAAVKSQAMMQRMIAAAMRQEATRSAHDNLLRKRNAMFASEFRRDAGQLFKR